jgi:hypothetical protein
MEVGANINSPMDTGNSLMDTGNLLTDSGNSLRNTGVPRSVRDGLGLLLRAYVYAQDLERDVWDFGLEIWSLRAAGVANFDLRWMMCTGLVGHALEVTGSCDQRRVFQHDGGIIFTEKSCFALTEAGVTTARSLINNLGENLQEKTPRTGSDIVNSTGKQPAHIPEWDSERHQLRFGDFLIKEYKVPSPNQERILMAFEEEGWPPRIDDPLSPVQDVNPKERLRNTIKSLNRCQASKLIQFMGDGTGEAIRWEAILKKTGGKRLNRNARL